MIGVLVAVMAGLAAWAGPAVPTRRPVADDVMSVQALHEARLEIFPLPRMLAAASVTEDQIRRNMTEALENSGIAIVEDEGMSLLKFKAKTINYPQDDNIVGLVFILEVVQEAMVHRLGKNFMVPTYSGGAVAITTRDQLAVVSEEKAREVAMAVVRAGRVSSAIKD